MTVVTAVQEDHGCHMLDMIVWLFGLPSRVTAQRASAVRSFQEYGGEDIVDIIMQFDSPGIIGYVHLSRVGHRKEESVIITGTVGTLMLHDKEVTLQDAGGNQLFHLVDRSSKEHVVRSMVRQFGEWTTGASDSYTCSLDSLRNTVSLVNSVRKSVITGRTEHILTGEPMHSASIDGEHHVWPLVSPESENAVLDQMHSSMSIYSRSGIYEVFEDRWKKMHGLKHALVCSSGTVAILVCSPHAHSLNVEDADISSTCMKRWISGLETRSSARYTPSRQPRPCYNTEQYRYFATHCPTATSTRTRSSASLRPKPKRSS